ncbi:MAG: carboxypeptidase-like regulatory protein [Mucilaginibacter sp.]|nr:carboxypeptidase-like regulatory protein [Mucilaginibacter sp.]
MKYTLLAILLFFSGLVKGQNTTVRGTITDARTNQTLPLVSVSFPGTSIGVNSDNNGKYAITTGKTYTELKFTSIGYKTVIRVIIAGKEQVINVKMQPDVQSLATVNISSGKRKRYTNKDNPAVELIRQVIAHKNENRMQSYDYIEYNQYEKLQFSFINVSEKLGQKKPLHQYKFLLDNRDTVNLPGKSLLPVYMEEKSTQTYYRKKPERTKKIVEGEKKVNIVNFVDEEGVNSYLNRMYSEVDIYSNNIFLMTNQFLSPIADGAPAFYKFFITDTIEVDNKKMVELEFTPRNGNDMLFEGLIIITLDGRYAVEKARLTTNKNINLNWVRGMNVDLAYEKTSDGRYHLSKSVMKASFGLKKSGDKGIFGERTITYNNYVINVPRPDSVYAGPNVLIPEIAMQRDEHFWTGTRGRDTLTSVEANVYKNIDSLQTMPSYKRTMEIINLGAVGFKSFGPVEVGPIGSFLSFNPVEGTRLRLGGRTTTDFSTRYYLETYGAYGFKDQKFKYLLSGAYSFNNKSIYKFPNSYIKATVQRDVKIPGEELSYSQSDSFFLSFTRGVNNKYLYNDYYKLDYVNEFENHFSYALGFKSWKQSPGGSLYFINQLDNVPNTVSALTTSELSLTLRYAPHEALVQGKLYRITIPSKYPIISLDYHQGIKDLFGGGYNYQNLRLRVDKRFYLSQLGYADVTVEGGYLFGQVSYPLLTIHQANQTYYYDPDSYNLMNFLEFVSDHYASFKFDYCLNGFIFNKIPLLKKLKWREYISFKALYGGVRDENNPLLHPSLLQYPVDQNGIPLTYTLSKAPYTEGSLGIGNIYKIFRVDLVERFDYLNHPNTNRFGIRGSALFDF